MKKTRVGTSALWDLTSTAVGASRYLISVRRDEDIVNWVKENEFEGHSLAGDPAIRDKLAELWIEAQVCRLMTMRSMSLVERGGNFTYEGAAEKVWAPEHGVRTTETISQILGPYAQLLNGSEDAIEDGVFAHNLMGSFQSGINHGSVQGHERPNGPPGPGTAQRLDRAPNSKRSHRFRASFTSNRPTGAVYVART